MASANGIRASHNVLVGKSTFSEFCQQTSLHGWQHIQSVDTAGGKLQNLIPNLFLSFVLFSNFAMRSKLKLFQLNSFNGRKSKH